MDDSEFYFNPRQSLSSTFYQKDVEFEESDDDEPRKTANETESSDNSVIHVYRKKKALFVSSDENSDSETTNSTKSFDKTSISSALPSKPKLLPFANSTGQNSQTSTSVGSSLNFDEKKDNFGSSENTEEESLPSLNKYNPKKPEVLVLSESEDEDPSIIEDSDQSLTKEKSMAYKTPIRISPPLPKIKPSSTKKPLVQQTLPKMLETASPRFKVDTKEPIQISKTNVSEKENVLYCTQAEKQSCIQNLKTLKDDLNRVQLILSGDSWKNLFDKGEKLKIRRSHLNKDILEMEKKLERMVVKETPSITSWADLEKLSIQVRPGGAGLKQATETYNNQKSAMVDGLHTLHSSIKTKPDKHTMADDPKGLKVSLMPHQKHALAFLMWREKQKPPGGILADDMGLGKTLTMLSLILKDFETPANDDSENSSSSDSGVEDNLKTCIEGGTLVVCPASLISQWENEVMTKIKPNIISCDIYHGTKREPNPRRLARKDLVVTTYNLVGRENSSRGPLFRVKWKRIILDEAHTIRNATTSASLGVCGLNGKNRWCLTGTPVQNKELDLYSLLKFLKCKPFNDLAIWKKWVDIKAGGGKERLNTVMNSLMLRRTKEQLKNEGAVGDLPAKKIILLNTELNKKETSIYQKILMVSRTLFAEFLHQRAERLQGVTSTMNVPKNANEEYFKVRDIILKSRRAGDIQTHEILVILLRLRQICCHPALIKTMLNENEDENISEEDVSSFDLIKELEKLAIDDQVQNNKLEQNKPIEQVESLSEAASKMMNPNDPIFQPEYESSKIKTVIDTLKKNILNSNDKVIIVSQWSSFLRITKDHLKKLDIECELFTGDIPVQKRGAIVTNFNDPKSKVKVLLLSLTAGGVGLNLIGANHLILLDLHWNPQLEAQAQDRIFRFGQTKPVFIYKFVIKDTIEERILALQEKKLNLASNLISGSNKTSNSKLTFEDLRTLFNM